MRILVTGGAGFIGSAVIRHVLTHSEHEILNLDKLTYAGNLDSLAIVCANPRYSFIRADITDRAANDRIFDDWRPEAILNLAAESHVDRSIDSPAAFISTNIVGTYVLLEACRAYWTRLPKAVQSEFRFHHVSTDEVYGELQDDQGLFTESTPYRPNSPYAASKAASDHLVRAWYNTYGLPTLITNCSNNYGPYQFPEKLIPHMILNAFGGRPLPVYGDGHQVRDWLYVEDHARALLTVLEKGAVGETYNIGAHNERHNTDVVHAICDVLEEMVPARKPPGVRAYRDLVVSVKDRPGHDRRYAVDAGKLARELGWKPSETFETGLRKTVAWYLQNKDWWSRILDGKYRLERIGASV